MFASLLCVHIINSFNLSVTRVFYYKTVRRRMSLFVAFFGNGPLRIPPRDPNLSHHHAVTHQSGEPCFCVSIWREIFRSLRRRNCDCNRGENCSDQHNALEIDGTTEVRAEEPESAR
ncbi:unnamed protein product [Brassica oleracea]